MERKTITVPVGGHEIVFETGKIAKQANGSVVVRVNDTMLFASACAKNEPMEGVDFLPLRVDYQEKFSSVGRTVSGFIKREGRPAEREILTSRLIDRPIRPMFEKGYYNDTQLLAYVWSYDGSIATDTLAICATSAALVISDIPLIKPIGAVRVGMLDGKFVVNPSAEQQKESCLDLALAGTEDAILMIEGYCDFLTEDQVLEAIETGHNEIKKICHALEKWRQELGREKNRAHLNPLSEDVLGAVSEIAEGDLRSAIRIRAKEERDEAVSGIKEKVVATLLPEGEEVPRFPALDVQRAFKEVQSRMMRQMVLDEGIRCDGRQTDEIRFLDIEPRLLPRAHGSTLFTRGETQALAVCTLGAENMAQRYEDLHGESSHRFYLQYFFPPFSVGEVGRMGPAGRREVGHGKLAERAIAASLPTREDFPYVIRLESNITESNGSSSMASVCGGCLALMDAGVPIERPVSGIAMGLILEGDKHVVLSDILGIEDALGDMDFKITGDKDGITAFQMDIKVEGITPQIMKDALLQAKAGRIHILEKMLEVLPESRNEMSEFAPRIETLRVNPSKIGAIIGPGGKQIRAIIEETGVEIDINDEGIVSITANDRSSIERAKAIVHSLTAEIEVGSIYDGKVTSIVPFGLFVEVLPGKEGLCHISEVDTQRVEDLNGMFKVGDKIQVKVLDINERGQLRLSRKVLLAKA
jgi:polyribonucleotide nucleotidyltransferase